jgi:hypothetical protein
MRPSMEGPALSGLKVRRRNEIRTQWNASLHGGTRSVGSEGV